MYCPKCGTQNDDTSHYCAKCGTPLGAAPAPGGTVPPPPVDPRVRGGGSMPIPPHGQHGSPVAAGAKNPWIAVLLSFLIPGVGQFYNNDPKKGGVMLGLAILLALTFIGYLGIWIWAMIDAHQVASGKGKVW